MTRVTRPWWNRIDFFEVTLRLGQSEGTMSSKWLTFGLSEEQEDRFRQANLEADVAQARTCIWLVVLFVAAFAVNDYGFFGLSWRFYGVQALRLGLIAYSLLLAYTLRRPTSYRSYDRAQLAWGLAVAFFAIAVVAAQAFRVLGPRHRRGSRCLRDVSGHPQSVCQPAFDLADLYGRRDAGDRGRPVDVATGQRLGAFEPVCGQCVRRCLRLAVPLVAPTRIPGCRGGAQRRGGHPEAACRAPPDRGCAAVSGAA